MGPRAFSETGTKVMCQLTMKSSPVVTQNHFIGACYFMHNSYILSVLIFIASLGEMWLFILVRPLAWYVCLIFAIC